MPKKLKNIHFISKSYNVISKSYNGTLRFLVAFKFYFYNGFLTHMPSYAIRTFYLRRLLKINIGENTSIHMGCFFAGNKITIGNNNVISRNCYIDGRVGKILIKNNISISNETYLISMTHLANSVIFESVAMDVTIEDHAWIGVRAIILPGITIGKGSVVGAGSVVTKSVEDYTIVAGMPAKKIGNRIKDLRYKLHYFPFFNTDIQ